MRLLLAAIILVVMATPALTHSDGHMEYDKECCSDRDCAPVDRVQSTPEGDVMTSKFGTVLVPRNVREETPWKVKKSKDSRYHVCISETTKGLLCVYYPALF